MRNDTQPRDHGSAADLVELEKGTNPLSFLLFMGTVFSALATLSWCGGVLFSQALSGSAKISEMALFFFLGATATVCLGVGTGSAHQIQYQRSLLIRAGWTGASLSLAGFAGICWYFVISA